MSVFRESHRHEVNLVVDHPPSSRLLAGANESSTMFIAIIVGLICLFYLVCTFHCMRMWCLNKCARRSGDGSADTVLLHEGRAFNLTGDQRRAVLEAIFSESSKPATDLDVSRKTKKRRKGDDDSEDTDNVPTDVEIPGIATADTVATNEEGSTRESNHDSEEDKESQWLDVEAGQTGDDSLGGKTDHSVPREPITPMPQTPRKSELLTPPQSDVVGTTDHTVDEDITPKAPALRFRQGEDVSALSIPPRPRRLEVAEQESSANGSTFVEASELEMPPTLILPIFASTRRSKSFVIPEGEMAEEVKEEIASTKESSDEDESSFSPLPFSLNKHASFATVTSEYTYDDDSTTGDNVCPICLSGYKVGDLLASSKHCLHTFHKGKVESANVGLLELCGVHCPQS